MNPADDALANIYSEHLTQQKKATAAAYYEDKIVKRILDKANLKEDRITLSKRAKELTGKISLTFAFFHETYPDFPVQLVAKRIPYVSDTKLSELFNKFHSSSIYKTWEEADAERGDDEKALALIFDWTGVVGTQLVIHDWYVTLDQDNALRIIKQKGSGKKRNSICIEQLQPFIDRVLSLWAR